MYYYPDETQLTLYPPVADNGAFQYYANSPQEGDHYRPGGTAQGLLGDLVGSGLLTFWYTDLSGLHLFENQE